MTSEAGPRLPLCERRRPAHLADLVGNSRARTELRSWAEQWARSERPPARRAAVLSGPAGVGKTTAALALANDLGWTVVEMNASDARNETAIDQVAGRASISHTLESGTGVHGRRRTLILLDEADCLTGRSAETAPPRAAPPSIREFLRARYRSIEALNAAYGLRPGSKPAPFAEWDAISRTPGNAAWARLPAARADLEEWRGTQRVSDLTDRGGMGAIARLVRATRQPVVLTVNDERALTRYSPVFRTSVARIPFYPIRDNELRGRLEEVAQGESIRVASGALDAIVRRAHGDLRGALNDLDAISPLEPGPQQLAVLGVRDLSADLAALVEESMTSFRYFRSVEVQDRLDAPPDDLFPWVEENVPHFAPDPVHRAKAFDVLAAAERFLARARRARVWSQWSYASELLTGGVGLAIRDRAVPFGRGGVAFPQFLGEMGRSRAVRATRESLVAKVGARLHLSHRKTREFYLSFLEQLFRPARSTPALRAVASSIARELELTEEEVAFLVASEPDSDEVRRLLEPGPPKGLEEPAASRGAGAPPEEASSRARQRQLSEFEG